ncbi:hypothetical protein ACFYOC_25360 [Nocardiopsis alba]|uniref:hypothetical protein n=1 Tax=Nocardiopsis alba TaxID=53437 RepID=UPI003697B78E
MWRSWPHDFEPDGETPQETYESDFRWSLAAATQDGVSPGHFGAVLSGSDVVLGEGRGALAGYSFASAPGEDLTRVPIPANTSSLPRMYRVVARLDVAAHRVTPHVIEGTASSNPQLPAITRTEAIYDLPLWAVRRAGGNGAVSGLTDERVHLNPGGARACTSTSRPPNPIPGDLLYESDTGRLVYWHAGQWVTAADGTYPTRWQPIPLRTPRYTTPDHGRSPSWRWVRPGTVELRGTFSRSDGEPIQSGDYIATLPAAIRPSAWVRHVGGAHARNGGWSVRCEIRSTSSSDSGQLTVWHTYNPTWGALDGWTYDI